MDLNIILWIGGMLFSLGIFSVKVGFGLGFGRITGKGMYAVLLSYLALFVLLAVFSGWIMELLEPALKRGPYLHALMAAGMIAWGISLVRTRKHETSERLGKEVAPPAGAANRMLRPVLLLLIPCPVCLTAMTFSTWSALSVLSLPPALVGLLLGSTFAILSLALSKGVRLRQGGRSGTGLGVGMTGIGIYFITSLYLPAKIEEARGIYSSFVNEGSGFPAGDMLGVAVVLSAAFMAGYLLFARQGGGR
ncbi:MAG: DUF2162 domain-containing protein [Thermodesulfovibrionales bacterium]